MWPTRPRDARCRVCPQSQPSDPAPQGLGTLAPRGLEHGASHGGGRHCHRQRPSRCGVIRCRKDRSSLSFVHDSSLLNTQGGCDGGVALVLVVRQQDHTVSCGRRDLVLITLLARTPRSCSLTLPFGVCPPMSALFGPHALSSWGVFRLWREQHLVRRRERGGFRYQSVSIIS